MLYLRYSIHHGFPESKVVRNHICGLLLLDYRSQVEIYTQTQIMITKQRQ